ncbi:MAG: DUF5723 family protein [Cytophagaceae bacterium]|nr:DUF5723 family protein [Cytophagaceae bacterium]
MRKILFLFMLGILLVSLRATAQNFLGISTGTASGTHGLYLNPASIADSRHKVYFNVGTVGLHVNNNYARWNAPFSVFNAVLGNVPTDWKNTDGSTNFQPINFKEILDGKPKNGSIGVEVRGPSVMLTLTDHTAVALTTRLRAAGQVTGANQELLSLFRAGFNASNLWNVTNVDNRFNVNANVYGEIGASLAQVLTPLDTRHFLKVGATAKYLSGFYSGHFQNRGLNYRVTPSPTNPSQGILLVEKIDAEFGYSTQTSLDGGFSLSKFLGSKIPGHGWGFDAGLVYEFRPLIDEYRAPGGGDDVEEDKYRFRIGLALLDMGRIYYSDPTNVRGYTVQRTNKQFTEQDFNEVSGSDELVSVLEKKLGLKPSEAKTSFNSGLPTALSLNLDWRLGNEFYVNVAYLKDLHAPGDIAMRQPTVFAITPRLSAAGFLELSLPLVWINDAFAPGMALRLGPVFAGTDNLLGVLGSVKTLAPQGTDVYVGLAVPILRNNKKR